MKDAINDKRRCEALCGACTFSRLGAQLRARRLQTSAALSVPAVRSPDYVNKDKPTDFVALVLSWSPLHREALRNQPEDVKKKHAHQCFSENRFEWVLHGLWPQNAKASSNRTIPVIAIHPVR